MVYGETDFGESRYGEGESPPDQRETRAAQLAEQRGPPEREAVTDAEAFGAGLRLAEARSEHGDSSDEPLPWDLVINEAGSFATISGIPMLGQDLSFALARETSPINGKLTDERMADLANEYRGVIERDPRVQRVASPIEVYQGGVDSVEAEVDIIGDDGELHEGVVIPVAPVA